MPKRKAITDNNWNQIGQHTTQPPIPIHGEVAPFETAYHLPPLTGTTRQVAWARNLRWEILHQLLPNVMDHTRGVADPTPIYQRITVMRGATAATHWIDNRAMIGSTVVAHLVHGTGKSLWTIKGPMDW